MAKMVYAGDVEAGKEPTDGPLATGILRLTPLALARQLTSNRGSIGSVLTFMWFFLREFARAYRGRPLTDSRPSFPRDRRRPLPAAARWQAVDGKPGLRRRIVPYVAGDNFKLNLHHVKGLKEPYRGPVMLSPGACLRAEVFYGQPSGRTIVDVLLDKGYDVWVQNWRGGIDLPPNPYSLDQVALYDHPAAVATVLRETRAKTLKAIVHCQGSVSFTMAAVAGLTPDVTHVVSSAVSLHVCVTPATKIKQRVMLPAVRAITPYADAQWGIRPASPPAGLLSGLARVVRRECDNPVCSTASYMFGTGPDVLLRHENVDDDVHRWLGSEVGFAPIRLMHQLARAARVGHLVRMEDLPPLPADYVAQPPVGRTPIFTFVVGKENRMFLPDGPRATFQYFDRHQPDRHDIQEFAGFGHLDLFVGKNPPFEAMVGGLER